MTAPWPTVTPWPLGPSPQAPLRQDPRHPPRCRVWGTACTTGSLAPPDEAAAPSANRWSPHVRHWSRTGAAAPPTRTPARLPCSFGAHECATWLTPAPLASQGPPCRARHAQPRVDRCRVGDLSCVQLVFACKTIKRLPFRAVVVHVEHYYNTYHLGAPCTQPRQWPPTGPPPWRCSIMAE